MFLQCMLSVAATFGGGRFCPVHKIQKLFNGTVSLFQDGPQGTFGDIAGMVWKREGK
jgi:hypothetical protein